MLTLRIIVTSAAMLAAALLWAQEPSALARASELDREISKAKDLPDDLRPRAIQDLARRVRLQPDAYLAALAFNLAVSASEMPDRDTVDAVANILVDALQRSPVEKRTDDVYETLAEWVRYHHAKVTMSDPRFAGALAQLEADDGQRSGADFTLRDLQGHVGIKQGQPDPCDFLLSIPTLRNFAATAASGDGLASRLPTPS